jgi:sugar lactone lactonase YvrE
MRWGTVLLLATMAMVLFVATGLAWAAIGDTVADRVLGQSDFTSKVCNKGANQPGPGRLCAPSDAAVGPGGRLFVTDTGNNRVLSWPSAASFTNGEQADLVIGQADFTSGQCNKGTNQPGPAKLCQPYGIAVDGAGKLYVADQDNSRVLQYTPPFTTNMLASKVFGQADFTSGQCNKGSNQVGAAKLCGSYGVGADSAGNLYVGDTSNNRVLQYTPPLATNMQASKVFGQADFTSREANRGRASPSSHTLFRPFGVAADGSGNLYVADFKNHRSLEYDAPLASGMAAARVFGQGGSFATNTCNKGGVSANSLCFPTDVVDGGGNLYAVDEDNNRILEYDTPLTTNTTADQVFGQGGSFVTKICNNGGVSANSLCGPYGVGVDGDGNLYVGDYANHRILGYDAPIP